jgi:hypothetical protein
MVKASVPLNMSESTPNLMYKCCRPMKELRAVGQNYTNIYKYYQDKMIIYQLKASKDWNQKSSIQTWIEEF